MNGKGNNLRLDAPEMKKGQRNRRGEKENEVKNKTYNIFSIKKKRNKELESLHRNSQCNCEILIPHNVTNSSHGLKKLDFKTKY